MWRCRTPALRRLARHCSGGKPPLLSAAEPAHSVSEFAGLQTVPVPILVGPHPEPPVDAADSLSIPPLMEAASAADNGGGWFFSTPMNVLETSLLQLHEASGLPWWATMALAAGGTRMMLFPFVVAQSRSMALIAKVAPETQAITAKMKKANARGAAGAEEALRAQSELTSVWKRNGISAWNSFVPLVLSVAQLPIWMTFFFTIQDIAGRHADPLGFHTGGMLWFVDLTAKDPYYVLPVLSGASLYMLTLATSRQQAQTNSNMQKFSAVAAMMMIPFTSWMCSGMHVYWVANNFFATSQTLVLTSPPVRQLLGLPALPKGVKMIPQLPKVLMSKPEKKPKQPSFAPEDAKLVKLVNVKRKSNKRRR